MPKQIDLGISAQTWERYRELKNRRDAEALTEAEHDELIAISDQVEEANVRRMRNLVELARLRGISLDELMQQLGIAGAVDI
jgi:hypothetical protein